MGLFEPGDRVRVAPACTYLAGCAGTVRRVDSMKVGEPMLLLEMDDDIPPAIAANGAPVNGIREWYTYESGVYLISSYTESTPLQKHMYLVIVTSKSSGAFVKLLIEASEAKIAITEACDIAVQRKFMHREHITDTYAEKVCNGMVIGGAIANKYIRRWTN